MKKYINKKFLIITFLISSLCICMFTVNLKHIFRANCLNIFRKNIFYITNLIEKFKGLILIILIVFFIIILKKKWVLRIEKMSCGGITFVCNKPEKILKQNIKNFLDTKRTLFYINTEKDNFYDTINSYFSTYQFIRKEMSVYDLDSKDKEIYKCANIMIRSLNEFLTDFQSDYKRWYEYLRDNKMESLYNKDICEIQKGYRKYNEILAGFKKVNEEFIRCAKTFNIDISKWKEGI